MGNFSRNTFDRLKHYVGVRLQQGVPILDADWNEEEDIRRFEVRTFLRWFVGDGVPRGNDGFRITSSSAADDFAIAAGRILVDGWDAVNDWDEGGSATGRFYKSQRLFGNAALAAAWGVAPLPALTAPGAARTDRVYLDVWEREVNAAEDPFIVNTSIGIETAVRRRCEWVVRVAEGAAVPAPAAGHAHHELATLTRPAGGGTITAAQIADRRRTGLTAVSWADVQQILADTFGSGYTLDGDGQPNLALPLRQVVNDLLRGQIPGTPPVQVSQTLSSGPSILVDRTGAVWVFYRVIIGGTRSNIRSNRWDPATRTWSADTWLTTTVDTEWSPIAVEAADGSIFMFFIRYGGSVYELWYRRRDPATGAWGAETRISTGRVYSFSPVVDSTGDIWVFCEMGLSTSVTILRWNHTTGVWGTPSVLTTGATDSSPQAAVDGTGDIWVCWERLLSGNYDIFANRWQKSSSSWAGETRLSADTRPDRYPYVTADAAGNAWVFWRTDRNGFIYDTFYRRFDRATVAWGNETLLTGVGAGEDNFVASAVLGRDGDIWVAQWTYGAAWASRYTREAGWGPGLMLSRGVDDSAYPVLAIAPSGDLWAAWYSYGNNGSVWARRVVTSI